MNARSPSKNAKARIVAIADDDVDVAESLALTLALKAFIPRCFGSGTSLLQDASLGEVDCFVLDINMPGVDGWAVLTALRATGHQAPAIMISGRAFDENQVAKGNAQAVMNKPIEAAILLDTIEELVPPKG